MLKSLVIRRAFAMIDTVLLVCAIAAGIVVMRGVLDEARNPLSGRPAASAAGTDSARLLASVKARSDYEGIAKSHLFGSAGDVPSAADTAPPPPPPPSTAVEETKLNLALLGTASVTPTDPTASATIENKDTRVVDVYGPGSEIVPEVTLTEVHPREVIIMNKGAKEVLRMEEDEEPLAAPGSGSPAGVTPPPSRTASSKPTTASKLQTSKASNAAQAPERFSLKKNDFIKQLYVDYSDMVTKLKPEYYRDETGKVAGITASNLQDIPLASTLDLRNGDVLHSINGEVIDNEAKIIELVNRYRDSTTFRIEILRDGERLTRTYQLE